jgi:hypothetical protein
MKKLGIVAGVSLLAFGALASPAMAGCFDDAKSPCRVDIDTANGELVVHAPEREGIWGTGGVAIVTVFGQENGIWGTGGTAIPGVEVKVTIPAD